VEPAPGQVTAAREFLLTAFLGDFPWVGEADMANYLGLLVTSILRGYLRTLIPFGVVTSTMPGSGKTILTCGLGMLYGQRVLTWTNSDEELRKAITSVLADPVGTIIFDNLAEGTVIDSPVLARLITDRTWADRLLGGNTTPLLHYTGMPTVRVTILKYATCCHSRGNLREAYRPFRDPESDAGRYHPPGCGMPL
jgi:hypothetical protein